MRLRGPAAASALLLLLAACPASDPSGGAAASAPVAATSPEDAVPDLPGSGAIPGAPPDAVVVNGEVEPASFAEVRIEVPGTISAVYVQRGDRVSRNDVLAELDTYDRTERLAEARGRLRDARASSVGGVRAGEEPPEWFKAELRRRLEKAEGAARYSESDRRRIVEAGLERGEEEAAERAAAIASVRNRGRGASRTTRRAAEERVAAALVDDLSQRVRRLEDDIAASVVRSPIDGEIVSVRIHEGGQWNTRNVDPAFEILDVRSLVVRASVPKGLGDVMRPREVVWLDLGERDPNPVEAVVWVIADDVLRVSRDDGSFESVREVRFTVAPQTAARLDVGQPVRVAIRR